MQSMVETNIDIIKSLTTIKAPYSASVNDIGAFQGAMKKAEGSYIAPVSESPILRAVITTLDSLNLEAKSMADASMAVQTKGSNILPSDFLNITVKCQEFMFHCQLTSNIAKTTSDGVQQMFRQQS
jgi:hypothetical protein